MSGHVLFVGCFLLYFDVVTYVETLDSLVKKNCFLGRKSFQVSVSLVSVTRMSIGQPKAGFLPPKLKFELTKTSRKCPKFETNFTLGPNHKKHNFRPF